MRYNRNRAKRRLPKVVAPSVVPYRFCGYRPVGSSSHPTSGRTFRPVKEGGSDKTISLGDTRPIQVRRNHREHRVALFFRQHSLGNQTSATFRVRGAAKSCGGRVPADFRRQRIEIQIRSEWNRGVLSFRPTLKCFWLELSPKGKA